MDHKARELDRFEMLLRKMGHDPLRGYIEMGHYQDGMICSLCGHSQPVTDDDETIQVCLVLGDEV